MIGGGGEKKYHYSDKVSKMPEESKCGDGERRL